MYLSRGNNIVRETIHTRVRGYNITRRIVSAEELPPLFPNLISGPSPQELIVLSEASRRGDGVE